MKETSLDESKSKLTKEVAGLARGMQAYSTFVLYMLLYFCTPVLGTEADEKSAPWKLRELSLENRS